MNKIRKNLPIKYVLIFFLIFLNFIVFTQINQVGQNIQKNKTPKITSDNTDKIDQNIFNFSLDEWNISKKNVKFVHSEIEIKESLKDTSNLESKDAYAIIIGISDYPGSNYDLSFCDDDALGIYSMLVEDFNFERKNIIYLQDSNATKTNIDNAFNDIASQIDQNDIIFFYYSGHGGADVINGGIHSTSINSPHPYSNNYDRTWSIYHEDAAYIRVHFNRFELEYSYDYVLLGDTDIVDDWCYEYYTGIRSSFWSGWIPLMSDNKVYIRMITDYSITDWGFSIDKYEVIKYNGTQYLCSYDSIPSNPENYYFDSLIDSKLDSLGCSEQYVILDSCHSGGIIPEIQENDRYIMTACLSDEFSLESPNLEHGIFTNYFLESFDYAEDSNGDGVKSMEELYTYTRSQTISYSQSMGYRHHPQESDGMPGSNVLYPSIGSLDININNNNLSYSFSLYGNGQIENLKLILLSDENGLSYFVEDLTLLSNTSTGFQNYSGKITFEEVSEINAYGLFSEIRGNDLIFLSEDTSGDFDSDTVSDAIEIFYGMNPYSNDSDSDNILDGDEFFGDTDPTSADTDGDGLTDYEEVFVYNTNATNPDTDYDGIPDIGEILYGTDPCVNDSFYDLDGDGLSNLLEYTLGTYMNNSDSDGDGIPDGYEYYHELDPFVDDSALDLDDDGLSNYLEFLLGSSANNTDSDGDGMPDDWEYFYGLNLIVNDRYDDKDGDRLENYLEYQLNSNPNSTDTDGDLMPDKWEYDNLLNLTFNDANEDNDNDGLTNLEEYYFNTDPNNYDTDSDGLSDGMEKFWLTDPLDPRSGVNTIILNFLALGLTVVIIVSYYQYKNSNETVRKKNSFKEGFKIPDQTDKFNTLNISTETKPLERRDFSPSYKGSSRNYISSRDKTNLINYLKYHLPKPKSPYSEDGKKASLIALNALDLFKENKITPAVKMMMDSLVLGVPEPFNFEIKSFLINSLNNNDIEISISNRKSTDRNQCQNCGFLNRKEHRYCTRCGREL